MQNGNKIYIQFSVFLEHLRQAGGWDNNGKYTPLHGKMSGGKSWWSSCIDFIIKLLQGQSIDHFMRS